MHSHPATDLDCILATNFSRHTSLLSPYECKATQSGVNPTALHVPANERSNNSQVVTVGGGHRAENAVDTCARCRGHMHKSVCQTIPSAMMRYLDCRRSSHSFT